jgi:hypothetical protein
MAFFGNKTIAEMDKEYMRQLLSNASLAQGVSGFLGSWPSEESVLQAQQLAELKQKSIDALGAKIAQLKDSEAIKMTAPIPDYMGTITAWRGWQIRNGKLAPIGTSGIWEPKKANRAVCTKLETGANHDAPSKKCTCGYWTFRTMETLQEALAGYAQKVQVIGTVDIWGKVIECTNGFRAEYAYPKELWLLDDELEHLSWTYGVPIRKL